MLLGQHGCQPEANLGWHLADNNSNSTVNNYLVNLISVLVSDVAVGYSIQSVNNKMSRTELDSHANMPVMGRDALVVSDAGRVMEVNPFTPDYDAMKVKLVDAALKYDCPHEDKSYILLVRNALHVPSMDHNLIPPFMLREAGIEVNETPKIHKENPTVDDHAITFPNLGLRIPMGLWRVISYFPTSMPSIEEVNTSKNVHTLTPNKWNPHTKQYASCEQSLINWEGKVMGKTTEMKIILADIPDDEGMTSSMMVASAEIRYMDALEMDDDDMMDTHPKYLMIPHDSNKVASILGEV